jgi:hypothetical protein
MLLQQQIMEEIQHIPENKLSEVYDLIHYFRLGIQHEAQETKKTENKYPLRGTVINYSDPTDPVVLNDWDILK